MQNYNTPYSHVISHRSTDEAVSSLAAEIGRDPAFSASYGRSILVTRVTALWDCFLESFVGVLAARDEWSSMKLCLVTDLASRAVL